MTDKEIYHYGTKRHSGRYPWGSGGHSQQRDPSFLGMIQDLMSQGLSEREVATAMGLSTTDLRSLKAIEKEKQKAADISMALKLKEKGLSNVAIGQRMGKNESSIRALLKDSENEKQQILKSTKEMLIEEVKRKGPVDVGVGVEAYLGISRQRLNSAVKAAEQEGYTVHQIYEKQLGTGKNTTIKVLAPPNMTFTELWKNRAEIAQIHSTLTDTGNSVAGMKPIKSIKSKDIHVRYLEDGGGNKDGVIEIRPGTKGLDLGNSKYAQVRIGVDGTHYMKGMAVYSDQIPPGKNVVYNVSKSKTDNKMGAFKTLSDDPDNPFGTKIKVGGQRDALNVVYEEGDWGTWSRTISSQVLSKQPNKLAKQQLKLAQELKMEEFEEISSLTNPAVKAKMLLAFADDCDAAAVHLKAAGLPRQNNQVILPLTTIKPGEVYAPLYENGTRLALVRHPHGGIFEIPNVVVNNKNPEAKKLMGQAVDAIGIHPDTAAILSGADFDGDTVIAIPNNNNQIQTSPSLTQLKNFEPKQAYKPYDGMKTIDGGVWNAKENRVDYGDKLPSGRKKQLLMGDVSNLITDMTIKGASQAEIARAVKHSMVVIDSEKHSLNYEQSFEDNNIADLKQRYQGNSRGGASTIVSRASSEYRVLEKREGMLVTDPKTGKTKRVYIDPDTGEKLYEQTGRTYVDKRGKIKPKVTVSTRMEEFDPWELSSGTPIENLYADHAETMKGLANKARLEYLATPRIKTNTQAAKMYAAEVQSINSKIYLADLNRPRERKATLVANKIYQSKLKANPNMEPSEKKKLKGLVLEEARNRLGAKKPAFKLTDREWNAIQLGAVSHNKVNKLIDNIDLDWLKEKSMPRTKGGYLMTDAKVKRAKGMAELGYTQAEIASVLGVSPSTISDTLNN